MLKSGKESTFIEKLHNFNELIWQSIQQAYRSSSTAHLLGSPLLACLLEANYKSMGLALHPRSYVRLLSVNIVGSY